MPPSGTTGKSSSKTGARGPTGPSGEARSSPAGNRGGAPGATSRTSSSGMKSGPGSTGGSKTPGGSRGGGSGNSSVSNMRSGPGSTGGRKTPSAPSYRAEPRPSARPEPRPSVNFNLSPTTGTSFKVRSEKLGPPEPIEVRDPGQPMGKNKSVNALGSLVGRAERADRIAAEIDRQLSNPLAQRQFNQYVSRSLPDAKLSGSLRGDNTIVRVPDTSNRLSGPRPSVAGGKGDLGGAGPTPAEGKGDLGGYRGGGLAKSRRSYKIK